MSDDGADIARPIRPDYGGVSLDDGPIVGVRQIREGGGAGQWRFHRRLLPKVRKVVTHAEFPCQVRERVLLKYGGLVNWWVKAGQS